MINFEDLTNPVWEQQEGEPSLWFNRFADFYLDSEDLTEAYRIFKQKEAKKSKKKQKEAKKSKKKQKNIRPTNHWEKYENEWHWDERRQAKLKYDREEKKELERFLFEESLRRHYDLSLEISLDLRVIWKKLCQLITDRLELVSDESLIDDILIREIPSHLRAIAKMIDLSVNSEAHALNLEVLIASLDDLNID